MFSHATISLIYIWLHALTIQWYYFFIWLDVLFTLFCQKKNIWRLFFILSYFRFVYIHSYTFYYYIFDLWTFQFYTFHSFTFSNSCNFSHPYTFFFICILFVYSKTKTKWCWIKLNTNLQKTEAAIQNYSLKQVFLIGIVFQKYLSRKSVFSKVRRQVYVTKNEILNKHFPRTLFILRVTFVHVSHDFQKKKGKRYNFLSDKFALTDFDISM